MSACMHESHPVAFKFFHYETFSAKDSCSQLFLKFDTNTDSLCRAEKCIFLCDDPSTQFLQIKWNDLSGIGGCKTHFLFSRTNVGESCHKQTLPNQNSFTRAEQFA